LLFWRTDFRLLIFIGDGSGFLQPNGIGCPFFYWKDEYVAYLEQQRREGKLVDDSVNVRLGDGVDSNINKAAMVDIGGDSNIKDSIAGALTKIKKAEEGQSNRSNSERFSWLVQSCLPSPIMYLVCAFVAVVCHSYKELNECCL
jgi:hypothetical protein